MSVATMQHSDPKRWITIYPSYINVKRTGAQGRRLPKPLCVDTPLAQEIFDICKAAGFNAEYQKEKMYPRDHTRDQQFQGRVKVQLKNDDGSPVDTDKATRDALLLYVAQTIPLLKGRVQKSSASTQNVQETAGAAGKKKKKGR